MGIDAINNHWDIDAEDWGEHNMDICIIWLLIADSNGRAQYTNSKQSKIT